ncbi:anti-sigma factor family protein [Streptomyces sp. SBT349]|uniref:anti-sigma factor family protein n=1 Tax=Streptomyces sp. SBT349 TaxID=1580539 RepID=UPI00069E975B|nr:zf-HC2 domain-containing protein [Streptomyces sp. SBT349]
MTSAAETGPADHHLGESLAALVDGELSHDSRDRVLAHLATCPSCKAEADAQRELKSVFAESPLPGPSDGLLARLQGLPAADAGPGSPASTSDPAQPRKPPSPRGEGTSMFRLDLLPGGRQRESLLSPPRLGQERGFRIHETGGFRAGRGHRLAFAAAGAVSLAAFAIGGAVTSVSAGAVASGSGAPSTVAEGSPVSQAGAARTSGGRSEEEERRPGTLTAHTVALSLLSAPAGPIGPSGQLFPLLGESVGLSPASASAAGPSAEPSVLGALSPR